MIALILLSFSKLHKFSCIVERTVPKGRNFFRVQFPKLRFLHAQVMDNIRQCRYVCCRRHGVEQITESFLGSAIR